MGVLGEDVGGDVETGEFLLELQWIAARLGEEVETEDEAEEESEGSEGA